MVKSVRVKQLDGEVKSILGRGVVQEEVIFFSGWFSFFQLGYVFLLLLAKITPLLLFLLKLNRLSMMALKNKYLLPW